MAASSTVTPDRRTLLAHILAKQEIELGGAPIRRRSQNGPAPLSFTQQRLWFLHQIESDRTNYNVPLALRLRGNLNVRALAAALAGIVCRHEALRTRFVASGGDPVQIVDPAYAPALPVVDLENMTESLRDRTAAQLAENHERSTFDLAAGPLLRSMLVRLSASDHLFLITLHHIVSDGWSTGVLARELAAFYEAAVSGSAPALPDLPAQYADYAVWQRSRLDEKRLASDLSYWRKQLKDTPSELALPEDRRPDAASPPEGARYAFEISAGEVKQLRALGGNAGATLFMTLLAAFNVLLCRYSGQTDIVVGTPVAGRHHPDLEHLIGCFLNTLALCTDLSGNPTFPELLSRVRAAALGGFAHQELPFEKLVEEIRPERSPGRSARPAGRSGLFRVMLVLQNMPREQWSLPGLTISKEPSHTAALKTDLALTLMENESGGLRGLFRYDMGLFHASTVERMAERFLNLLRSIVLHPEARIGELPIADEAETRHVLEYWREPFPADPPHAHVHDKFADWAESAGDTAAIQRGNEAVTFRCLNTRSDQIAAALLAHGAKRGGVAAVFSDDRVEIITAILGILKAGCAFMPLPTSLPDQRLIAAFAQVKPAWAFACLRYFDRLRTVLEAAGRSGTACIDIKKALSGRESSLTPVEMEPGALGCVLFPSTTASKAIAERIGGIDHLIRWEAGALGLSRGIRVGQLAAPELEAFLHDIFIPLSLGGLIAIPRSPGALSVDRSLVSWIEANSIELIHCDPPLFRALARQCTSARQLPSLHYILSIGEPLATADLDRWYSIFDNRIQIVNLYGPAEATPAKFAYFVNPADRGRSAMPIGHPIPGAKALLIGEHGEWCPDGVTGEIHLRSRFRPVGYYQQPLLTAWPYIPDPFSSDPAEIVCKTGDLARVVSDGNFVYLNRRGSEESPQLQPDLTVEPGCEIDEPLRDPIEEMLAGIWTDLLRLNRVRAHDNFFELGGHSLLAMRLASRIQEVFHIESPVRQIFENPTLEALSAAVQSAMRGETISPDPVTHHPWDGTARPASFVQRRLFFLQQLDPESTDYNVTLAVRINGPLDLTALRLALGEIVERHDALRSTFRVEDGNLFLEIGTERNFALPLVDLEEVAADRREPVLRLIKQWCASTPFQLERGPVLRPLLARLHERSHLLCLTLHHIVTDGWSTGILARELASLYETFSHGMRPVLPKPPLQYSDYARWQTETVAGLNVQQQIAYWKDRLTGAPPLDLPVAAHRVTAAPGGAKYSLQFSAELSTQIRELGKREGATLFMCLLAGFSAVLSRYTGQHDMVIGAPVAGRGQPGLETVIGCFLNTLALRLDLSGRPSFRALVARVREITLEAFARQDIPYERVVEAVAPDRKAGGTPLFRVIVTLQNMPAVVWSLPGLTVAGEAIETSSAKTDLMLTLTEGPDGLRGGFQYNTALFDHEAIARLAGHLETLLAGAVADPACPINDLPILTAAERKQMLEEWNDTPLEAASGPQGVHELLAELAAQNLGRTALRFENQTITAQELEIRANRLAHYLREYGVKSESFVGVCLERSPEMVIAVLAVLKAGGAYLPLDPEFPPERLRYMVSDAAVPVVITQQSLQHLLQSCEGRLVLVDDEAEAIARRSQLPPDGRILPDQLAYLIYTSGSTGKPKGVQITHGNLMNLLRSILQQPGLRAEDRFFAITTLSFDIAGLEIFTPLAAGAELTIANSQWLHNGPLLRQHVEQSDPTALQATPSFWRFLIEAGWKGSNRLTALIGGEAFPADLVPALQQRTAHVWNMYGPTETTIWSCIFELPPNASNTPIGRPIGNTQAYVVDRNGQPLPVGIPGELLIGGAGVARGYWQRPELTAERFIPNPFTAQPGERLYRTGDLVRWMPDGNLEFLGRFDDQVKLHGHRIELKEIEAALAGYPGIQQAIVVVREDNGAKRLAAYVTTQSPQRVVPRDVRQYLRERLPEYMTPAIVVELPALPLTPNGKVDRKALAKLPEAVTEVAPVRAALSPAEEIVTQIWRDVLGVEHVSPEDDFFELGGDSLLAMRVVSRIYERFQVNPPVRIMFLEGAISHLARSIEMRLAVHGEAVSAGPAAGQAPVPKRIMHNGVGFDRLSTLGV